ncbi:YceD family protein [Falsiroseomonas sp. E2-1-a20]|uniref:YceD family protein n=1 Tax=Falsiroseomonas sp. E2-1-a20 TaxID=3239300 RepID=UPI003F30D4C5
MTPEFSRPHRLGAGETRSVELRARPDECAALAARFAIPAVERLEARLTLTPETGGTTRLTGTLEADVVQDCVVTLDPVPQQVRTRLDLRILPPGTPATDDDPDSPDEVETTGNGVDLGEVVAEQLALALDPYPRAPDAAIPPELEPAPDEPDVDWAPDGADAARPNPFAALARIKRH